MKRFLILAYLLAPVVAVAAPDMQPVESIREAALSTVLDRSSPGVRAEASVDASLRLPACSEPLEALAGNGSTVEVGCPSAGWRLYVPVRIQRQVPVVVLTRPVAAGQALSADMLATEMRDSARLAIGGLSDPSMVQGQVARRALGAGSVVSSQDLHSVRTIRRGDLVTLVSRSGGIEVRAQGRAMAAAGPNERVSVENTGSRRVVQGVVRDSGEVDVVL